jgi:small subunit ribosomal protein S20
MPNTASAERRMRSSARKQSRNKSIKTELKTLEKNYQDSLQAGKKEDAAKALRAVASALDKAAKRGVVPKSTVNRKKSRLAKKVAAAK